MGRKLAILFSVSEYISSQTDSIMVCFNELVRLLNIYCVIYVVCLACYKETACTHYKSVGEAHLLCDICMKAAQGRFCSSQEACNLCNNLDKVTWRRIMDTRRKRDAKMCQQNLHFEEMTDTLVADPSEIPLPRTRRRHSRVM